MLVLKVGGNEIDDANFLKGFARAVAAMKDTPIIVHGGGKEIADLQLKFGLTPQFVEGLRVTDDASLAIAEMVLSGRVNKRIVCALINAGADAMGMSGIDRGVVRVEKMLHPAGDLGRVGKVVSVRGQVLCDFVSQKIVPVISPISLGDEGAYNVNADSVACAIAAALNADAVVFVTNVAGVMKENQVIPSLTPREVETLIKIQVIRGGMIPKVRAALDAVSNGAKAARITNLEGLMNGSGTVVTRDA
ncbi:MAG: acetylglutamate kinase [Chloroflexi bacterium]|nr:acetylglutamate kinase [Chloroflexota bacterium]